MPRGVIESQFPIFFSGFKIFCILRNQISVNQPDPRHPCSIFQGKSLKFTCRGRAKVKSSLYACGIRAGCLLVQGSKFKVQGYMLKDNLSQF
jgi:hypothetical protein